MKIPFSQTHLEIVVEKKAPAVFWDPALDGASDQEVERFARNAKTVREPRWEVQNLMYGFRL
jgi:hypothetical protein